MIHRSYIIKGFTLIETIISLALIAILAASIFPFVSLFYARNEQIKYDIDAALVLQEGNEAAYHELVNEPRSYPDGGYSLEKLVKPIISWKLSPLGSGEFETVSSRYERVIYISSVCRNQATGQIQTTGKDVCEADPSPSICDSSSGNILDDHSEIVTTRVRWLQDNQKKCLSESILVPIL